MVRHWTKLVLVMFFLLGILVSAPQIVVTPLVLAQTSQSNQETEAQSLFNEGVRLRTLDTRDSLQQSLDKVQQALTLFRATGNRFWEAITLNYLGSVYQSIGQPQQALTYYQQALPISREGGNSLEERLRQRTVEAIILGNIGAVYQYIGQPQEALSYYQQALPISREVGNRSGEATILGNIGQVYQGIGQPQEALTYYQQSLSISREASNSPEERLRQRTGEASILSNIGLLSQYMGQLQQALSYYQQALPISREVGDRLGEATTLNYIGFVYQSIGKPQEALSYFQQALPINRELGNRSGEASILNNIGIVYQSIGQPQEALTYYQQALQINREVSNHTEEASILNNIGVVYQGIEQPQEALSYFQQALQIKGEVGDRSGEATALNNIGEVYRNLGQPQEALSYFQQALQIKGEVDDRSGEAIALNNIGEVYRDLGQPQEALTYYQQALGIQGEVGDRSGEAIALYNLAWVQNILNDLPTALKNVQSAIVIIEDIRDQLINPEFRTSYFATVQDYYKLQINLLMELHQQNPNQGYDVQAFNVTEKSKARTLLELLTESKADIRNGVDPQLLQQERDIRTQLNTIDKRRLELANSRSSNQEQIAALEIQRTTLQTQYRNLQTKIRATSPKYAALRYPEPLTLEQIQQQILDDDTLILSYSLDKEHSYLWLVSKTDMTSHQLPAQKTIEDLVNKKARPQFTNRFPSRGAFLADTSEVSDVLLTPILEKIGNKRLVIISDGALQYLPFGALPDLRVNDKYQPLLVNNEVVYLPSASTLQTIRTETQNRTPAPRSIAVLADPVFATNDPRVERSLAATNTNELPLAAQNLANATRNARGGDWNRLPYTRQEAETILNLFPPDSSLSLFDFQANRENALSTQLSQYRFIHWATHGFANAQKPELSGVVMSLVQTNGQLQDGYLLLEDIFNLNFNAELVVLSACETGLGEVVQGEGLIGLTRGLMYAGTSRVVTSLWSVLDDKTAILMGKFYKNMLEKNLSPAEALRTAQLEVFRSQGNWSPHYWAAFTLQGEWR